MNTYREIAAKVVHRDGERRLYYQGEQCRVVVTTVPSGHVQNEHRHDDLYDIIWVVSGSIEASEKSEEKQFTELLGAADMVEFPPGLFHSVANRSPDPATLVCIKLRRSERTSTEEFALLCESDWIPAPHFKVE